MARVSRYLLSQKQQTSTAATPSTDPDSATEGSESPTDNEAVEKVRSKAPNAGSKPSVAAMIKMAGMKKRKANV